MVGSAETGSPLWGTHSSLREDFTSPFNMWYLDDGTLGSTPAQVLADFHIIQSEGIKRGLRVMIPGDFHTPGMKMPHMKNRCN